MSRRCIFCPARANTREHAWAQWFSELFPKEGRFLMEGGHIGAPPQKRGCSIIDLTINRLCAKCNNGWMSALESEVKPLLTPMIAGQEVTLPPDAQGIIVRWIVKTVMVFEFAGAGSRDYFFTPAERQTFRETLQPPGNTFIWIAGYVGKHAGIASNHDVVFSMTNPSRTAAGYESSISFGQFAFQLMSHRWTRSLAGSDKVAFRPAPGQWDRVTQLIWPGDKAVIWPPETVFDDVSWEDFATRWVRTTPR